MVAQEWDAYSLDHGADAVVGLVYDTCGRWLRLSGEQGHMMRRQQGIGEGHLHSGLKSAGRRSVSISNVQMLKSFYASWLMATA